MSQIRFNLGANYYSAKILNTGEVVPDFANLAFSKQGTNLVLTWPAGWTLQSATNVLGPYADVSGTTPYTNDMPIEPQRFFRLRQ